MTTSNQWDNLNRLLSVSSPPSAASALSFGYSCNNANQRVRSTLADGSYWLYDYDALGQVRSGRKYWSDQSPVAGQQFEYTHDDIGNRTQTKAGGDQNRDNQRTANYGANSLNQYTNRDVPAAVDVMGLGFATNGVTVNGQAAYRKGEYFRAEVPVSNGSTSVWQSVTVHASGQTDVTGNAYVPKNQEKYYYDGDGNLTNDGRWSYTWDAENRLVKLAPNTSIGPRNSLKFEYDWQGRRIHKQVWGNTNWNSYPTNDVKFVYGDWNLVAELNATNNAVIRSFMWGRDLSGTIQGAGGVGGLLEVVYKGAQTTNCFAAFDGNGNVLALVDGGSGSILGQYEYGPFGEVIRATGPMTRANPFRFSTKYQDDETDLVYYGYRYYNASTGRWISPDPIGEDASPALYSFVLNDPAGSVDLLGLLNAEVVSVNYMGHGSCEIGFPRRKYLSLDDAITGQVPLDMPGSKPGASLHLMLDDSFAASIQAITSAGAISPSEDLQMSTFLQGDVKVRCPCPFRKARANWTITASVSKGNPQSFPKAQAIFDNGAVNATPTHPSRKLLGVSEKQLDSSYVAVFHFDIGAGWSDTAPSKRSIASRVSASASFTCVP